MRSGRGGQLLKLAVSLALVVWLVRRYGGDQDFRATISGLHPGAFALAAAIVAGGLVLSALRWKILLAAAGVAVPLARAARLYFVGYFFNLLLPTTVGGDVIRAAGIGRGAPLPLVAGSIVIERILGFGCLLAIGITASVLRSDLAAVRNTLLAAGGAFVVGVVVLATAPLAESAAPGRLGRALRGLRRTALEIRAYGFHRGALAAGLLLSVGWQLALVAANAVLSGGLGGVAPAGTLLSIVPVVQAISMIPVSFGGLGVREMGYEFFFRTSGLDPAGGVALAAAFLGVTMLLAAVGAAVYLAAPVRTPEAADAGGAGRG